MTTLIAAYTSSGDRGAVCIGRCDAKCYEAADSECTCICGGMNHSAGQQKATDNTRQMAEQWIKDYSAAHSLGSGVQWDVPAAQLALSI